MPSKSNEKNGHFYCAVGFFSLLSYICIQNRFVSRKKITSSSSSPLTSILRRRAHAYSHVSCRCRFLYFFLLLRFFLFLRWALFPSSRILYFIFTFLWFWERHWMETFFCSANSFTSEIERVTYIYISCRSVCISNQNHWFLNASAQSMKRFRFLAKERRICILQWYV